MEECNQHARLVSVFQLVTELVIMQSLCKATYIYI